MEAKEKYKCLIVDDEVLARQLIRTHLAQMPDFELAGECASATEAEQYLKSNKVDLMFLDIQMPESTGIDLLRSLEHPPKVIFTTAYSEFALEGYELNVLDYLLKPIIFERFAKAISKAREILRIEKEIKESSSAQLEEKSILIRSSHQLIRVELADILYIEGLHKYVKIITKEKTHITLFAISAMENKLPARYFYRCHRSFIINLSKVDKIEGTHVIIGAHTLPVSKANKALLIEKLGKK